jgi:methionine aminopeptidase
MAITKSNFMRPYPTLPTQLIHPNNNNCHNSRYDVDYNNYNYPNSFFPPYAHTGIVPHSVHHDRILLHDPSSIAHMKKSATLARQLLDYIIHPAISRPGRTTDQINDLLHRATLCRSAYPSPLNYSGFPKSVCTSINEVVCHGIPDSRPLQVGDILSCDVSVYLDGVHGDNCGTIVVGDVDEEDNDGVMVTENGCVAGEKHADLSWDWYSDWLGSSSLSSSSNPSSSSASLLMIHPIKRDWPTIPIPQKTNFASLEEEERIVTARRLVQAALESRDEGVAACKPGGCLSEVGAAIHAVADAYG